MLAWPFPLSFVNCLISAWLHFIYQIFSNWDTLDTNIIQFIHVLIGSRGLLSRKRSTIVLLFNKFG